MNDVNKFNIFSKGDSVRFTGARLHESTPSYYPRPGTVGVYDKGGWVQWPKGTTSGDDRWHAPDSALEVIKAAHSIVNDIHITATEPCRVELNGKLIYELKTPEDFTAEHHILLDRKPPVFSWDAFKRGEIAVHCDTEEKVKAFLKECDERGFQWNSGCSCLSYTGFRTAPLCIAAYYDKRRVGKITSSTSAFYAQCGLPIIPYPFYREVKRNAKVGEWVRVTKQGGQDTWPVGTIGKATSMSDVCLGWVRLNGLDYGYIRDDQYVVLEDYTPPTIIPRIIINRWMLVELNACAPGLRDFDERFSSGEVDLDTLIADHERRRETSRKAWLMQRKDKFEAMQGKEAPKPKFVPHIKAMAANYGTIGKKTKFKDVFERPLAVGDVVEVFSERNCSYGDAAVCEDSGGIQFIMGIKGSLEDSDAGSTRGWKLLKKRSHRDVKHGESVDGVTYIKEQP